MDVQTENTDPPPGESQPSGKIRKGFKLFGKRKPGNIFSIRSKGDGNSKSPVIRSNTLDGLSENAATDSEQDSEKGQEVSQGEREQADEELLSEDGVLAAAPPRTSISSACSAKSLSFLSLLRGGRRGVGDRRVHTVSQPVGRQRLGLKGLFGSVKFRSKDKEDKEDIPPSPLLMSSRANSVEIIKEDLTLTPKSPRSLESPETESSEHLKSLMTPDGDATPPPENITPQVTTGKVSSSDEPASEPPLVPGDTSLSSLLADISSLLTFDSISGGKDIMADVEAEWGKASSAISAVVSEVPSSSTSLFSKPTMSSPLTSTSVSAAAMAKPYSIAASTTAQSQPFTPLTKSTLPSIIQTPTTSSTLTPNSLKVCLGSTTTSTNTENKSNSLTTTTKISTTAVTLTSLSAPVMSSTSIINKPTQSSTSATTTAPPNAPATIKASLTTPPLTSMAGKVASEIAAPPTTIDSVSNANFVATLPLASAKPPVTHSPPSRITTTTLDSGSSLKSSSARDCKAPVTVTATCTVTTKPFCPPPVITSKVTTFTTSAATSSSVSMAMSKPTLPLSSVDQNKTCPLLVTAPDLCPPATKTQPSHASVVAPSSTSSDRVSATTKSNPAVVSVDKITPAPTLTAAPTADAFVPTGLPTPPALGHSAKAPTARAEIPISVCKDTPTTTHIPISVSKDGPAPAQIPVYVSKDTPWPAKIPVCHSKASPVPTLATSSPSPTAPWPSASVASPVPTLATSPPYPTAPWPSEPAVSAVTRGRGQVTVDGQLVDSSSTPGGITGAKTEELNSETQTIHQFASKERKTPQVKASGLSKIPVVGGGRTGKQSVRDSQHVDNESSRDPPTPVLEEERHFNSHNAGRSRDKVSDVEANVSTLIHTQEEDQQPAQPKVLTSLSRDSKIPVKHSTQSHTASQIPQPKEPSRTKIPVSKVPVRRAAHKPAAAGSSTQIRK
ncbi:mucin-2 [Solea solea]|uniref:mucin-2 n=1 Tax=Solea solea TaxID=90069 RepID=UPI00272D3B6D|nr:mucin-2 [Solea solea]